MSAQRLLFSKPRLNFILKQEFNTKIKCQFWMSLFELILLVTHDMSVVAWFLQKSSCKSSTSYFNLHFILENQETCYTITNILTKYCAVFSLFSKILHKKLKVPQKTSFSQKSELQQTPLQVVLFFFGGGVYSVFFPIFPKHNFSLRRAKIIPPKKNSPTHFFTI